MYFGQPLRRREDVRFLTGAGHFVDDIRLPGMAYIAFARSPHAHALIRRISTERAASMRSSSISFPDCRAGRLFPCRFHVQLR